MNYDPERDEFRAPPRITFQVSQAMADRYRRLIPDGVRRKVMTKMTEQLLDVYEKLGPVDAEIAVLSGILSIEEILARRRER